MTPSPIVLLASPRRREILRLVWREDRAAGAIAAALPDVTFGAVSMHLRALADAGLVSSRAEGRQRIYRARREALGPMAAWLEEMWDDALWRLKVLAEFEATRRGPRPTRPSRKARGHTRRPSRTSSSRSRSRIPAVERGRS